MICQEYFMHLIIGRPGLAYVILHNQLVAVVNQAESTKFPDSTSDCNILCVEV